MGAMYARAREKEKPAAVVSGRRGDGEELSAYWVALGSGGTPGRCRSTPARVIGRRSAPRRCQPRSVIAKSAFGHRVEAGTMLGEVLLAAGGVPQSPVLAAGDQNHALRE